MRCATRLRVSSAVLAQLAPVLGVDASRPRVLFGPESPQPASDASAPASRIATAARAEPVRVPAQESIAWILCGGRWVDRQPCEQARRGGVRLQHARARVRAREGLAVPRQQVEPFAAER